MINISMSDIWKNTSNGEVYSTQTAEWAKEHTLRELVDLTRGQFAYLQGKPTTDPELLKTLKNIGKTAEEIEEEAAKVYDTVKKTSKKSYDGITKYLDRFIKTQIAGGASLEITVKRSIQEMVEKILLTGSGGSLSDIFGLLRSGIGHTKAYRRRMTGKIGGIFKSLKSFSGIKKILKDGFEKMKKGAFGLLGDLWNFPMIRPFQAMMAGAIAAGTVLVKTLLKAGEMFRGLYDTGQHLNGSLIGVVRGAALAQSSMEDFVSALEEHSQSIKLLTTGGQDGAFVFAEMTNAVKNNLKPFHMLMMRTSEINSYIGQYLDTAKAWGQLDIQSSKSRIKGVTDYLVQLTELTAVTGRRREQLNEEVQAAMREASFANYLQGLGPDVRDAVQGAITQLQNIDPSGTLVKGFKQILTLGTAIGDEAVTITQLGLGGIMHDLAATTKSGVKLSTNQLNAMALAMKTQADILPAQQRQALALAEQSGGLTSSVNEVYQNIQNLNLKNKRDLKDMDPVTSLFAIFEQLKNQVLQPFYELGVVAAESLNNAFGDKDLYQRIVNAAHNVAGGLKDLLGDDKTVKGSITWFIDAVTGVVATLVGMFDGDSNTNFWNDIYDLIDKMFIRIGSALITGMGRAIKNMISGSPEDIYKDYVEDWEFQKGLPAMKDTASMKRRQDLINSLEEAMRTMENEHGFKRSDYLKKNALGGIATKASIFGERGPEAAIPLNSNMQIPIARIKGDFNRDQFNELISLTKDSIKRQEAIAEQQMKTADKLDKLGNKLRFSGNTVF